MRAMRRASETRGRIRRAWPALALLLCGTAAQWAGPAAAYAGIAVARSAFCRSVEAREPVGEATVFPADVGEVTFFTQIVGAGESDQVLHVWIYDGREMAIVPLDVEGPSWRTWSTKRILPEWKGDWIVEVRTVDGAVVHEARMRIE